MLMKHKEWLHLISAIICISQNCSDSEINLQMLYTHRKPRWLIRVLQLQFTTMVDHPIKSITECLMKTIWSQWMRSCRLLAVHHLQSCCKMLKKQTKKRNFVIASSNWYRISILENQNRSKMPGDGSELLFKTLCISRKLLKITRRYWKKLTPSSIILSQITFKLHQGFLSHKFSRLFSKVECTTKWAPFRNSLNYKKVITRTSTTNHWWRGTWLEDLPQATLRLWLEQ